MSILANLLGRNKEFNQLKLDKTASIRNENRIIRVRFPSMAGDTNRSMTIQELKENYKNYLIIDPMMREQVDIEKLANLEDIQEVVAMPPISGGKSTYLTIQICLRSGKV